jgi:hypothetical protein
LKSVKIALIHILKEFSLFFDLLLDLLSEFLHHFDHHVLRLFFGSILQLHQPLIFRSLLHKLLMNSLFIVEQSIVFLPYFTALLSKMFLSLIQLLQPSKRQYIFMLYLCLTVIALNRILCLILSLKHLLNARLADCVLTLADYHWLSLIDERLETHRTVKPTIFLLHHMCCT